ncbi:hypothetical protein RIF29_29338 [Crotalaria pallida]|uniref:Uncharacterized protein n=1 Tax=Crotalaria pallida TaxID=3830 RepID=A0AAN9HXE7_CROPI
MLISTTSKQRIDRILEVAIGDELYQIKITEDKMIYAPNAIKKQSFSAHCIETEVDEGSSAAGLVDRWAVEYQRELVDEEDDDDVVSWENVANSNSFFNVFLNTVEKELVGHNTLVVSKDIRLDNSPEERGLKIAVRVVAKETPKSCVKETPYTNVDLKLTVEEKGTMSREEEVISHGSAEISLERGTTSPEGGGGVVFVTEDKSRVCHGKKRRITKEKNKKKRKKKSLLPSWFRKKTMTVSHRRKKKRQKKVTTIPGSDREVEELEPSTERQLQFELISGDPVEDAKKIWEMGKDLDVLSAKGDEVVVRRLTKLELKDMDIVLQHEKRTKEAECSDRLLQEGFQVVLK